MATIKATAATSPGSHLGRCRPVTRTWSGCRATRSSAGFIDRYPDVGVLATRLAAVEAALERRGGEALLGSRLTRAELRLLALLESDITLKQIASEHLFVSIHTVTSHAQRLYRRLGVRNRAEAVAAARERGLL